ncbi:MAG: type II toxin-antitoxin system VapC family toxin [Chloroflexi bacterium]|nr:type II toxin-antitoxin system VapC family toxin [Chloroflexota bacterium]
MSIFFLDSSALTKRYLQEPGSDWVAALTDPATGNIIVVAEITRVEVAAALAARHRAGAITLNERDDLVSFVLQHFDSEYQIVAIEPNRYQSGRRSHPAPPAARL